MLHELPPHVETIGLGKRVPSPEGELVILEGIDLRIARGETVAVVGESGSGKTTLLGLMAGLDLPSEGRVRLDAQDLGELDEDGRSALRARHVGFVFQTFQLLPSLNALENVMLPLELGRHPQARQSARRVLERVGLARRVQHYPRQLSGGEQQRVALARAYATRPGLLFADEPTGNLDRGTGRRIGDLLFELNRENGTTLVLVTHDPELASQCGRVIELDGGRLVENGARASSPAD